MKSTFKTKLLLGAAVTALSFGAAGAQAATLTGNSVLGAGDAAIAADEDINLNGNDLQINQTDNTNIGAITDTNATPDGNVTVTTTGVGDVSQTIGSIDNGTGNFTLLNTAADGDIVVNVTGAMTIGSGTTGNLVINNADTTSVDVVTLTVGGNASVAGSTTITANDGAGEDATLNLNGATNVFTGGIILDDGVAGLASVNFANTAAGTFTGTINSVGATDEGTVNVINGTNEMRFVNDIGATGTEILALNVGTEAGAAGTAEFDGNVLAGTIAVNGEQGATVADFDGNITATNFTIDTGTVAADTATVTMSGTTLAIGTLTLDDEEASIDATLTFDGTSLQTLTGNVAVTNDGEGVINANNDVTLVGQLTEAGTALGALNVATGKTFTLDAAGQDHAVDLVTLTGTGKFAIESSDATGDLTFTGAIAGAADGSGSFQVGGSETVIVTGAVGTTTNDVGSIRVIGLATGEELTLQGNVYTNGVVVDATTATDVNTVQFGNGAGDTTLVSGNITAGEDNVHVLDFNSAAAATVAGNIGTSALKFATVTLTESATLGGNVYATTANIANTKTLTLTGTSATVSANIAGAADTQGSLTVGTGAAAANVTFTGEIGDFVDDTRNNIGALTVSELATATFNEDVEVGGALTVGGAGNAATASFMKGLQFTGASAVDGTVYFGNRAAGTRNEFDQALTIGANQASTVTLAGGINQDNAALEVGAEGATFLIKKTATFDPADVDNDGNISEGAQDAIIDSTGLAVTRTGTLTIGLASDTLALDNNSQIRVIEAGASTFNTGIDDGTIVLRDTAFIDLQNDTSTTTALNIRVVTKSAADVIGADATGAEAADTLLALSNASLSGELLAIKGNLQGAGTAEAAQDIANSLAPTVDAGAVVGATAVVNTTAGITNTQLASLRDGTETGMMAGNISQGLRAWGQVFGQTGDQDERDGVAGFEVDTYGFAVGLDTETLAENWIWGLAFAYADTEVDSKGVNDTNTEIDSYQVSLYTNYDIDDRTYISGQVGYVWGDNDQTRSNIGGAGLVANSDYDSETWTARLEAGRKYAVGSNTILTPKALVNYQHYSADGYTETGTVGNAGLVVDSEDLNLFEIGVGVDASWDYQNADGSFWQPKIGVGVRHDLIGDEYETTSRFIGAGGNFNTDGFDPAQTTFNVGADVTYFSTTNWELSAGYDFEVKSDYDAHSGMLRAGYKF